MSRVRTLFLVTALLALVTVLSSLTARAGHVTSVTQCSSTGNAPPSPLAYGYTVNYSNPNRSPETSYFGTLAACNSDRDSALARHAREHEQTQTAEASTPTPTATAPPATPTVTATAPPATATPTVTATRQPRGTRTPPATTGTATATATATATSTPTVTLTPDPNATATPTATETPDPNVTATATPAATLTLTAQAEAGRGRVTVSWVEVANAVRYELMVWWDAGTGWQRLDDGGLTGTTFTHSGVTVGTTYYYTVRAVDANGAASAWSAFATATPASSATETPDPNATATPTATVTPDANATATATPAATLTLTAQAQAGAGRVTVSWIAAANAVRYELMVWWDGGTGWQRLDDGGLTGTTFTHSDVTVGTTYYYTVRAVDANGAASAWSAYDSATVSTLPAPELTAQAEAGTGRVTVSWNAAANAVRYELMVWWDAGTGWQRLDDGSLTGITFTHSGVTVGTTYYYTVRAVDANDVASAWSAFDSAVAGAAQH